MEGFTLLLFCLSLLNNIAASTARDTINTVQSINDGQTIVSDGGSFALGFFSLGNSKNRYVGIWYNKIPTRTVVWVANRDNPLTDSSGVLNVNDTGILVLLNHNKSVIWSSNSSRKAQFPVAKLLDSGNLIVQESGNNDPKDFLWQSFDYPCDTLLPGQKFGRDLITGLNRRLTSWNSPDDPSIGKYNYQVDTDGYPQIVLREGTVKRFRFGPWNGIEFSGPPKLKQNPIFTFDFVSNEKEVYYMYELVNSSVLHRQVLTPDGFSYRYTWSGEKKSWTTFAKVPGDDCDHYANCGANAKCNINNIPACDCLKGFVPKVPMEDLSTSCVRRTTLSCHGDGFLNFSRLKLPDTERSWFNRSISLEDCRMLCMKNCSCTAYAALDVSNGANGCLLWFDNLIDMKESAESAMSIEDIYIRMAGTELGVSEDKKSHKSNIRKRETIIISCVLSIGILILCSTFIYRWNMQQKNRNMRGNPERDEYSIHEHQKEEPELPLFDIVTLTSATNNFSTDNILGEGGFGSVYKGMLEDEREIAVKRLSQTSRQGLQEFKNEVMHVVKLQHRNLVRLLGCCIQAEERMLVYEFMANKSLDSFIFDDKKGMLLDWSKRFYIINGIARGLLYLHQDSRHRIVHRDLKAGNVLLDGEMNPKISDFGLARSFGGNENEENTKHVVGTYGYLSPEYIIDGQFSTKSDVYSFGVLILEIVSGKRNRGFSHKDHHYNLLGHAWILLTEGKWLEIIDASIKDSYNLLEVLRSIHVGLLCVQRSPEDRPSMSTVILMLGSEWILPQPKVPGFYTERELVGDNSSLSNNDLTISQTDPR